MAMCLLTVGLMWFIDLYVLWHLSDWTLALANKYLILNWTGTDRNLVRWFPLIVGIVCTMVGVTDLRIFIKRVFWTLLTVMAFLVLALFIALFFWTIEGGPSPLLPEYIKYQPFANYWTVFIVLGVLLPMFPLIRKRRDTAGNDELINK